MGADLAHARYRDGRRYVAYCQSLVQRLGQLAAFLQVRQDRVQAYNRVVTALNGPTECNLIASGAANILETVGAQAGVIYVLEQDCCARRYRCGVIPDTLPALAAGEGLPASQFSKTVWSPQMTCPPILRTRLMSALVPRPRVTSSACRCALATNCWVP